MRHSAAENLRALADDDAVERIEIADLLAAAGDRGPAGLNLLFALPNVLPMPPGISAILGAPLLFLTLQMAFGLKPWLPRLIAARSMARKDIAPAMRKVALWISQERAPVGPRLSPLLSSPAVRFVGVLCSVLALALVLPIPFANMLPAAAISLCAFGVLRRDGLWVLVGIAMGTASFGFAWGGVQLLLGFASRL